MLRKSVVRFLAMLGALGAGATVGDSLAPEPALTPAEKQWAIAGAREYEQSCLDAALASHQALRSEDPYLSRLGALLFKLQPPEGYCACSAASIESMPPHLVRAKDTASIKQHVRNAATACVAAQWREGFTEFCNGLRSAVMSVYDGRLGEVDEQKGSRICSCAGDHIGKIPDGEFGQFIANSVEEWKTVYAALDLRINASSQSMSGLFASCGAGTMAEVFGINPKPGPTNP